MTAPKTVSLIDQLPKMAATMEARGASTVPLSVDGVTSLIKHEELPYVALGDGTELQLLQVDLNIGLWISKTRFQPGTQITKHYHTGLVYAVTLKGKWFYKEYPTEVNEPGSYLFEPAGSLHTLCVPEDQDGETEVWFAIYGANLNVDDDGNVLSIIDAPAALSLYRGACEAAGEDISKLIVIGED
ncbi:MAG: 2,4'-dihydroxyacetophenone dioxygenase family protein [Alphaproteobacteria bacterium]